MNAYIYIYIYKRERERERVVAVVVVSCDDCTQLIHETFSIFYINS